MDNLLNRARGDICQCLAHCRKLRRILRALRGFPQTQAKVREEIRYWQLRAIGERKWLQAERRMQGVAA